jgi:hypothetical protein
MRDVENLPVFFLPKHCTLGTEAMVSIWPLSVSKGECAGWIWWDEVVVDVLHTSFDLGLMGTQ